MTERRRYERVPFFCEVSLTALPEGLTFPARTVDISLGGVGLMTPAAFEPSQTVSLFFRLQDGYEPEQESRVMGRVVNLRADTDANLIGVEFFEPLSPAGNPRLLKKFMK